MNRSVHTIVVHCNPHFEELVGIMIAREFGEKKYPNISRADIEFCGAGGETPDGRSVEEWERDGYYPIGVWRGKCDEHPGQNNGRKQDECSATLVAKDLGVADRPELRQLLRFALSSDLAGGQHPLSLAALLKMKYRQIDNPMAIINWAIAIIKDFYKDQIDLWEQAKREFEETEIDGPFGRRLKLVVILSREKNASRYARMHGADIIIQRWETGNTQIFTKTSSGLKIYDIVQMIRLEEQKAMGQITITRWEDLAAEGFFCNWHFQEMGQMLLNGSSSHPDVTPTLLSLERIKEIVRIGVNPRAFYPNRAENCKKGFCSSTSRNPCPWYPFGFHRCRKIRYQMKNS